MREVRQAHISADEFEVAIFLTETDTRHSLVVKHKHFRDKVQTKLTSNSTRLIGASSAAPIDLDRLVNREESDDIDLSAIPAIGSEDDARLDDGDEHDDLNPDLGEDGDGTRAAAGGADGKKLGMDVSYEGFAIYGRVLCLMVKRRDGKPQRAMMEDWIASTQIPPDELNA
jgi:hypothetical protein